MNQLSNVHSPRGEKRELAEDSAAEDSNIKKQLLNLTQEHFGAVFLVKIIIPSEAYPTACKKQIHFLTISSHGCFLANPNAGTAQPKAFDTVHSSSSETENKHSKDQGKSILMQISQG